MSSAFEEVESSHKETTNMRKVVSQNSSMSMHANYPSDHLSTTVSHCGTAGMHLELSKTKT